jgi:peroxiredoxin
MTYYLKQQKVNLTLWPSKAVHRDVPLLSSFALLGTHGLKRQATHMKDLSKLPDNLPVPVDDGACAHLPGTRIPTVPLVATSGDTVNLGELPGIVVVYFYPMTGRPDSPPLVGWNEIPGARGCTPQSCAFRDHHSEFKRLDTKVFGVSAQPLREQREAKIRLALPFELLNDSGFALTEAMRLPTFEYEKSRLIRRLTIVAINGIIRKVFYPVFPPNRNADDVVAWLRDERA